MNEQLLNRIKQVFAVQTPDIPESGKLSLFYMIVRAIDEADRVRVEFDNCRNELCNTCGAYTDVVRLGKCHGCKWKNDLDGEKVFDE